MKRFINKIFPQNQKVLNFFKIAYIFLFIISIPHMFESIGAGASDTFYETIAALACWLLFFIAIAITIVSYSPKGSPFLKFFLAPILIIQIFLYFYSIKAFAYTSGLVNPMITLPILIVFIILNKNSQNFSRNLVLFLFIPFSLIAFDNIFTLGFQITCPFTTPKAEYSPMYLPRQFFHEESINGKIVLIPNAKEIVNTPYYKVNNIPDIKNTVFIYSYCNWENKDVIKKIIERKNIIICIKTRDARERERESIFTYPQLTIERVDIDKKNTILATLYSKVLLKKYEKFWLRRASESYCGLGDFYSKFVRGNFKNKELSYQNYIKLEE